MTSVPQMKNFLGCAFKTTVVDTGALEEDAPAVLMLHDVPGSHRDLGSLIGSFQRHGARVIAVNLPGEPESDDKVFDAFFISIRSSILSQN